MTPDCLCGWLAALWPWVKLALAAVAVMWWLVALALIVAGWVIIVKRGSLR